MHREELAEWAGPGAAGPVELRVPAHARHLATLRMVARDFGGREGFTDNELTDLTVAVDAACTCLIRWSAPGAMLTCRLVFAFGRLTVSVSTTTLEGRVPSPHALGWRVLDTMTDTLSAWRYEHDPQRSVDRVVHIRFAKRFAARAGG
ncbi:ATP-binding protein [Prauserella sp. PE36]|uniref:ATP-binding protein n=1 Tax=Prauserella sp. PE36 TaxID=1504709 RepID=UPI000D87BB7B|nr:ATP-binding protein [Prauserella sp. PE36]PXY21780.1 hypothetical protein BAY59_30575 [Prauserella coralliicola]RBM13857.1 ATP-binding protein [Prauserella sp. PE36]